MKKIVSSVVVAALLVPAGGGRVAEAAAASFELTTEPVASPTPQLAAPELPVLNPAVGLMTPTAIEPAALEAATPQIALPAQAASAASMTRLASSPAIAVMTSRDARVDTAQRVEAGRTMFDGGFAAKAAAGSGFFAEPSQTYSKWGLGKPKPKPQAGETSKTPAVAAKDRAGSSVHGLDEGRFPAIPGVKLVSARAELDDQGGAAFWRLRYEGYDDAWSKFRNHRRVLDVFVGAATARTTASVELRDFWGTRQISELKLPAGGATLPEALAKAAADYPELRPEWAEPAIEIESGYSPGMMAYDPGESWTMDVPVWRVHGRSRDANGILMTATYTTGKLLLRELSTERAENPQERAPELLAPSTPVWVKAKLVLDPPYTRTTAQLDAIRDRVLSAFGAKEWHPLTLAEDAMYSEKNSWRMKITAADYLRLRDTWTAYHAMPTFEYAATDEIIMQSPGQGAKDRAGSGVRSGDENGAFEPYVALRPEGEGFDALARRAADNPLVARLRDGKLYAAEAAVGEDGRVAAWNLRFAGFASRWDKFRNRLTRVSVSVGPNGADYRRASWEPEFFGSRKIKGLSHPAGSATAEQALARAARDYPEMRVLSVEAGIDVDGGWVSSGMIGDTGSPVSWDVPVWRVTGFSKENSAIPMRVDYLAKDLKIRATLFDQAAQAAEVLAPETPVWARFRLSLSPPHDRTQQKLDAIRDRVIRDFHGEQWGPLDLDSDRSDSNGWRMRLSAGDFVRLKKLMEAYDVSPTFEYAASPEPSPAAKTGAKERAGSAVDPGLSWSVVSGLAAGAALLSAIARALGRARGHSEDLPEVP